MKTINRFSSSTNGVTRLAYSKEGVRAMEYITQLCKKENLSTHIDACGNLIAKREGRNPKLPSVSMGSHIDTVIEGGQFDGLLGVVSALEVIRRLNDRNEETLHP